MGGAQTPLPQRTSEWVYLTTPNMEHPCQVKLCARSLHINVPPLYPECKWPMMTGLLKQDQDGRAAFIQSPWLESEHLIQWDPHEAPAPGR